MANKLEILDKTFDKIRALKENIGLKNFLPCVLQSLST